MAIWEPFLIICKKFSGEMPVLKNLDLYWRIININ